MITKRDIFLAGNQKLPELSRDILVDQLRWLSTLRWYAVSGIVGIGWIAAADPTDPNDTRNSIPT